MEYKRSDFARLYFISDKALIDILANSKDPLLIQKDIGTCFEGIKLLIFTKKEEIEGFIGKDKEEIHFEKDDLVDVNLGDRKGCVEKWLGAFEWKMMKRMKDLTIASKEDSGPARID